MKLASESKRTPEDLFAGRPKCMQLFKAVRRSVRAMGPVQESTTKTQVSFGTRRKFAWVWLPQMWIRTAPEDSIVLTFGLDHRVKDARIKESLEPYPGRFVHHIVISRSSEIDARVKAWLRDAYEFSNSDRKGQR